MTLTPELIAALTGLLTAVGSIIYTWWNAHNAAEQNKRAAKRQESQDTKEQKRDEVALLREEVERLSKRVASVVSENERLQDENAQLTKRVAWLEATLIRHGIEIPPMPKEAQPEAGPPPALERAPAAG